MARRLLYVGPDDEIADLVSRVRSAASGDEIGFVVPPGAGVFQTPLNFRLINQMAARQGVTAAIVSADPRTQQLARDAGIGIFTSASAYEQDIAMGGRRPLGGQLAGGAALAAGAVASAIPPAPSRTLGAPVTPPSGMAGSPVVGEGSPPAPSPWTLRRSGQSGSMDEPAPASGPAAYTSVPPTYASGAAAYAAGASAYAAGQADRLSGAPSGIGHPSTSGAPLRSGSRPMAGPPIPAPRTPLLQDRRRLTYIGIAAIVVVFLLVFLVFTPSAKVTVTITGVPLTVSPTIQGTPDAGQSTQPDHLLSESVSDTATQQFTATPTGTHTNPATAATAQVQLEAENGSSCFINLCSIPMQGAQFETTTNPAVTFAATAPGLVINVGPGGSASNAFTVTALSSGASENNEYPSVCSYCASLGLTAVASAASSGGTDAEQVIVASATDVANWTTQITQFETTLTTKAKTDLLTKAGSDKLAIDPGGGGELMSFAVSPNVTQTTVGSQATPQTVTVTMTAQAAAYNPASVEPVVLTDLQKQLTQGTSLVAGHLTLSTVHIIEATSDGNFAMSVTATDYSQTDVNLDTLRGQLTGRSPGSLKGIIAKQISGVKAVSVHESPFGLPYMPLFGGNIKIGETFVSTKAPAVKAPSTSSPSVSPSASAA